MFSICIKTVLKLESIDHNKPFYESRISRRYRMAKKLAFRRRFLTHALSFTGCILLLTTPAIPGSDNPVSGQSLYVPVYSHIYSGNRETPFLLTVTISVRNTDPVESLTIESANYHGSDGRFLSKYLEHPKQLEKFATLRFVVNESDTADTRMFTTLTRCDGYTGQRRTANLTLMFLEKNRRGLNPRVG